MALPEELPRRVVDLIASASIAEYATVSAAGLPVDTPVLFFPSDGLRSIDLATGLSYPAKAERARRNPRVGLLIEGGADEPVISIAGMAAVKDADLQANVDRYLSESAHTLAHDPDWSLARRAVWYWTRILVQITPTSVVWWDSPAAMDRPPQRWDAPPDTPFPPSDPAPPGRTSKPARWQERPWQALAAQALDRQTAGHLSVIDADGFPRPLRAQTIALTESGFALAMPPAAPWNIAGKACLTFGGIETFVGEATGAAEGRATLTVERSLPIFPMTQDMTQLWEPTDDTRAQLMRRLHEEAERRGQPIPTIPADRPPPSAGYRRRIERRKARAGAAR
jgi:hypothetical protein